METKTSKEDEPTIQVLNQIENDKIFEPSLLSKEDAEYASKASQMFTLPELASENALFDQEVQISLVYEEGKPFQKCPECPRLFSALHILKRHILLQHRSVVKHRRLSTSIKPSNVPKEEFICKFCPYFSYDKDCFDYHVAVMHQPKVMLKRLSPKDFDSKQQVTHEIVGVSYHFYCC